MGRRKGVANHGYSKTRVFSIWSHMIDRCYNQNHNNYHRYGGRGITVCKEWRNNFLQFLSDMGEPPTSKHSIERINNNENYCKNNCRWATQAEQSQNQERSHKITYHDKTQSLKAWIDELGLNEELVRSRIKRGWPVAKAFTLPSQERKKDSKGRFIVIS